MTKIWVTGLSQCSALGTTLATSWSALLQGKSGVTIQQPFAELAPCPLGLISAAPSSIDALLAVTVAAVLANAGLSPTAKPHWGVVIGSSRGYQAEIEQLAWLQQTGKTLSASRWMAAYSQSPAVQAARLLQGAGPILSPRAACATGLWAIAQGAELIRSGQCDWVIAGAVEAPITPLTLIGFRQMGVLAATEALPFDRTRAGFGLGEGAALVVLERAEHAQQRGAKSYGTVLGYGLGNAAYHISTPEPQQQTAITTVQDCLSRSQLSPQQVQYIHAHGTGTPLNDAAEAYLIRSLFPHQPAVSSTKGATGHTLGASGALGAVFCLMALHQQVLPPCVGLKNPAYPLNLIRQAQAADLQVALCLSFGFGGQNAAIAFGNRTDV
jgi:3-oxoacyl-[acyl-carrier-protein] synthase II